MSNQTLETKMRGSRDRLFERVLKKVAGDAIYTTSLEDRERWLEEALKGIPSNSRILDAGAGETQYSKFCRHLNYVSQDFGKYNGQGDGSGLQTGSWDNSQLNIISDITSIPEPDNSFDAIMCIEVLEHIPAPIDALREFSRLLKPGGQLILTAPFASLTHFAPYHFYSGFNSYFYHKWLQEFGFKIIDITPNGNYFEYLRLELGRLRSVVRENAKNKKWLSPVEYFCVWVLLRALKKFSLNDTGSHKTLCFGYHLKATKLPSLGY